MAFTKIDGVAGAADSYRGTSGIDELGLTASNAWVGAQPGNDRVALVVGGSGAANITVNGGAGNDTLFEQGSTNITDSVLKADDGNDIITLSGTSRSTVSGGVGVDQISTSGLVSSSLINGNQDDDSININSGATSSSIYGGIGQDAINLTTNITSTTVRGNEGNDIFDIAAGTDLNSAVINGNQGNDLITINAITAFTNTTIFGGSENDTVNAAASAVGIVANGDSGNDNLTGGTATDSLTGGEGNDSFTGGNGNDNFIVDSGIDVINDLGNGGGDEVITSAGTTANATVTASNTVTATSVNNGTLNATLAAGILADSTVAFNALAGAGVTLNGAAAVNRVLLTGSVQADTITGGGGTDTLTSTNGADQLAGGAANDLFNVDAGTSAVTDFGLGGGDEVDIEAGAIVNATIGTANTVTAASDNAGTFNVATTADIVNDQLIDFTLLGTGGVTFTGAATNNRLRVTGSALVDDITGGGGIDTINALVGADSITGNGGNDTFIYADEAASAASVAANTTRTFDQIGDFVGNAGAAGDTIQVDEVGAIDFNAGVAGTVVALTVNNVGGFNNLGAALNVAVGGGGALAVSTAARVQVYDITLTGTGLAAAGITRLALVQDGTAAYAATDLLIGMQTGAAALNANDFISVA